MRAGQVHQHPCDVWVKAWVKTRRVRVECDDFWLWEPRRRALSLTSTPLCSTLDSPFPAVVPGLILCLQGIDHGPQVFGPPDFVAFFVRGRRRRVVAVALEL